MCTYFAALMDQFTCCQNVNRKTKASGCEMKTSEPSTPTKQCKIDPEKHSYPSFPDNSEDNTANLDVSLLKKELAKSKPSFDAVTSLMSHTFSFRRKDILDTTQSLDDIVREHPCLSYVT